MLSFNELMSFINPAQLTIKGECRKSFAFLNTLFKCRKSGGAVCKTVFLPDVLRGPD